MNRISNKRQQFRLTIRKDFIQNIFEAKRKQIMVSNQIEGQSNHKDIDQTNIMLLNKSTVVNGLNTLIEKQGLLLSLEEKLRRHLDCCAKKDVNYHQKNMLFILTICSNCLLDDIKLHLKQYMFTQICLPITYYFTDESKLKQIQSLIGNNYSIHFQCQGNQAKIFNNFKQIQQILKQIEVIMYFLKNFCIKKQQFDYELHKILQQTLIPYAMIILPMICRQISLLAYNRQDQSGDSQQLVRKTQAKQINQQYLNILSELDQFFAELFSFEQKQHLQIFAEEHQKVIRIVFLHIQFFAKGNIVKAIYNLSGLRMDKLQLHRDRRIIQFLLNQLSSEIKKNTKRNDIIFQTLSNLLIQQHVALLEKNNQRDFKKIVQAFDHSLPSRQMYKLIGMMVKTPLVDRQPYCQVFAHLIIEILNNWSIKDQQEMLDLLNVIQEMYSFDGFDNGIRQFNLKKGKQLLQHIYNQCENSRVIKKIEQIWDLGVEIR